MCVFMYHGLMVLQCPLALIKGSTGSFLTSTGNQSTAFVFHCNYYCSTSTGWILRQYNLTYPFVDMHDQGGGGTTDRNHLRYQVESNRISSHLIEWHDLVVLCMYLYTCEYISALVPIVLIIQFSQHTFWMNCQRALLQQLLLHPS